MNKILRQYSGLLVIFLVVGLYFLANAFHYSATESSITGYGEIITREYNQLIFLKISLVQFMAQLLYLVLACAGIAFIAAMGAGHRFRLFGLIIFTTIICFAYLQITAWFIHGRYLDPLIPLILIAAFSFNPKDKKEGLLLGLGIALISQVAFFSFWIDTINCFSNIYLMIPIDVLFPILVICFFASFLFLLQVKDKRKITTVLFIVLCLTFTASNIANFQYTKTTSDNAYEYCTIGQYINHNQLTNVVFDEDIYQNRSFWGSHCLINYYYGKYVPMGNITEGKYFITSKDLSYQILASDAQFCDLEVNRTESLKLYKTI